MGSLLEIIVSILSPRNVVSTMSTPAYPPHRNIWFNAQKASDISSLKHQDFQSGWPKQEIELLGRNEAGIKGERS